MLRADYMQSLCEKHKDKDPFKLELDRILTVVRSEALIGKYVCRYALDNQDVRVYDIIKELQMLGYRAKITNEIMANELEHPDDVIVKKVVTSRELTITWNE